MARNISIALGSHFDEFIATQLENGRFTADSGTSARELVQAKAG